MIFWTGTCKAAEPYKVGKRMADILLEILNLNKTEIISSDIISNQEFTEVIEHRRFSTFYLYFPYSSCPIGFVMREGDSDPSNLPFE
jgi:hypothetical protein